MKVFFITGNNPGEGGGSVIIRRNIAALQAIVGRDNLEIYTISYQTNTIKNFSDRCFRHYVGYLTRTDIKRIRADASLCEVVWIDGSFYGAVARELRKGGYKGKIITFFHNIEKHFGERSGIKRLLYPFFHRPIIQAELDAIQYSDHLVVLTQRDADYILSVNYDSKVTILPSSLEDQIKDVDGYLFDSALKHPSVPHLLFVGSYFYANVNGLSWFVEHVLPHVNVKLTIVGANMDKLDFERSDHLEIHGFVDDLGSYYRKADAVIAPVFEGSGMKTKTTEALMWGKFIIGTEESFCGFDIDNSSGVRCLIARDFISAIGSLTIEGVRTFNPSSRSLFIKKYSLNNSISIIREQIL